MRSIRIIGDSITPRQISTLSLKASAPSMLQNRTRNSEIHYFKKVRSEFRRERFLLHYPSVRAASWPTASFRRTIFRGEFVVGVLVDVVSPDGDVDAVGERPVPLHVPLVSID